jgi:hypothetical protein
MPATRVLVEVHLGNAAMITGDDVAGALAQVARRLREDVGIDEPTPGVAVIRDVNGNRVGTWSVE